MARLILAWLPAGLGRAATPEPPVMNRGGVPYTISNPPGSTKDWRGQPGEYSVDFNENAGGPVEHFDVYGEVRTKYSQVYWRRNAPINLPPALVQRFEGKVMAITGYEVDQVTHSGPQTGSTTAGSVLGGFACYPDCSDGDRSIPIYNQYNHHYFSWLVGQDAEVYDLGEPAFLPNPTRTGLRSRAGTGHGFPTNIVFQENPGGEFRKSYHGYPAGFAQLLHSPHQWLVEPMQIDTHHRDYSLTDPAGPKHWFLPEQLRNNMTDHQSALSPLIECPCTDRIEKKTSQTSTILTSGTCAQRITTAAQCTAAAANVAQVSSSAVVSNASLPSGCLLVPVAASRSYAAVFNTAASSQSCAIDTDALFAWEGPVNATSIGCADAGRCLPSDPKYGCTEEFRGQCTWDTPAAALRGCGADPACQGVYCSSAYAGKRLCFGRATATVHTGATSTDQTWRKVYRQRLFGQSVLGSEVSLSVSHSGTRATITMSGPDGVWFGVGFGASAMEALPYAIIVNGTGGVEERKLANHGPGTLLAPSVAVVSSEAAAGRRTVVLERSVAGATQDHYSIPTMPGDIDMISAVGSTPALAYHRARTGGKLTLLPTDATSCMCAPRESSFLVYMNETTQAFNGYRCEDAPRSDMARHGDGTRREVPNPACRVKTYHGGLQCCKHSWFLTDRGQASLIPDKTDIYFLKWRYYFQEYLPPTAAVAASHRHLHHWVFLIDAKVNDYEEDNAHYGSQSIGWISANLTAREMGLTDVPSAYSAIVPLVMTPHMHAPSAIREELWNADTGEILCNASARYGSEEHGSTAQAFNEANYVSIPPCIFGAQPGLQTPFSLSPSTRLTAFKYFNNTFRHLGQMAQWTGLMVYEQGPPPAEVYV